MKQMWDKKASNYTRFSGEMSDFQRQFFAKLDEFGVDFRSKTLIDIGCGTGVHTLYLAKICKSVLGVDSSENMLKVMQEDAQKFGVKNLSIVCSDFENFITKSHYDIAFCTMSPAVKSQSDFDKFTSLGDLRVYLWWNKPRFSSILQHFYTILELKGKGPKSNDFEEILKNRGVKFHSCILDEERLMVRTFDEAVENIQWHLQIDSVSVEKDFIKSELMKFKQNEKIEEKIISSMKLLVF